MKNILKISFTLLLCLTLAACQEKTDPSAAPVPPEDAATSVSPDAAPSESSSGEPAEVKNEGLAEYQSALRQIVSEPYQYEGVRIVDVADWLRK